MTALSENEIPVAKHLPMGGFGLTNTARRYDLSTFHSMCTFSRVMVLPALSERLVVESTVICRRTKDDQSALQSRRWMARQVTPIILETRLLNSMHKPPVSIGKFLAWLFVLEAGLIAAIVGAGMYAPQLLGPCITVASILGIAGISRAAFSFIYNRQLANYPVQPVPIHAERRSFQSFSFGAVNMALSIHAAVDDEYLHLEPALVWRWLGAASASIPFGAMIPGKHPHVVMIDNWKLTGPAWCLVNACGPPDASQS